MKPWEKMTVQERLALWAVEDAARLMHDARRAPGPAIWEGLELLIDGQWKPATLRTGEPA